MINNKNILAIIPARGGSKGVPRKNIKDLNGKPLIAYTIEGAKKSKYIDKVIVSTEDEEIAGISKKYNLEVPFLRPKELAEDDTPGINPILHAVKWFHENKSDFEYVICLQCTSPFRKAEQIDDALENLINKDADSIVSVCESEVSPYWMKRIENGVMKDFAEGNPFYSRRQDIPEMYRLNGAIYIAKTEVLIKNKNWYTKNTLAYVMDKKSSIDIDDTIDFKFAEFLMREDNND
ncbi:acylneuraminate cytidylyltransferase family protein [Clostridium sp. MSJ-4]|uniref:Acylneuraminate cytidylyltransferase family protein n=1 Tax=Clostridium simiarum TaxID=2841506 RepID=A0ABS6EXZ2_9CLOT|nr:acylneuraminate cytidylyltransferase family protein [Clostridium simiarum]MBU5591096.1 acylneuraminate cytidylyltransferase family protein [Clostridium simiarum]